MYENISNYIIYLSDYKWRSLISSGVKELVSRLYNASDKIVG